ncbi:dihydroxyacetone kinase phosphoryl donor subunit DhaM [Acerihabitans sp. TG2]|uniref:dihydroxyacetone kinase phosphoryl donor subunit DhaM n=1 Tax=Acerihabitans sp. TG2 TaxID=3096008 RepID=UPI002B23DF61|nr:dihydroxyacetone kinase phosphoryl donor subunit DhaM [Acerihabitans sp. TG2]MEA9391490.1 dihydroxyacetone kinase phosphoryl donor subunit DhaM [Acerihabitans sp. TG2]
MVNIVVVSHSLLLAQGVEQLAQQMIHGDCRLAIAAGVDDPEHPIGTDAIQVMAAIESVFDPAGVLVLMDLGSALLSAETALELLDPAMAARVMLCAAPLVEGTLAAVVAAANGGDLSTVKAEALGALAAKSSQLGMTSAPAVEAPASQAMPADCPSVSWTVLNPNGLHVRPAAKLAATLAPFKAQLALEKGTQRVDPRSLNQLATLQIRQGDHIRLLAAGSQATEALAAFDALARQGFGEALTNTLGDNLASNTLTGTPVPPGHVRAPLQFVQPVRHQARRNNLEAQDIPDQQRRLDAALAATADDLDQLACQAQAAMGREQGAIFSAHAMLLQDEEIIDAMRRRMVRDRLGAGAAAEQELLAMAAQYQAMADPYLRARELDIHDILNRLLGHLAAEPVVPLVIDDGIILVAQDLLPSEMVGLDRQRVKGICLSRGDILSHTAILAQALAIPMVVGVAGCMDIDHTDQEGILDITTGSLRVTPANVPQT